MSRPICTTEKEWRCISVLRQAVLAVTEPLRRGSVSREISVTYGPDSSKSASERHATDE
jgi:hypothetical protein